MHEDDVIAQVALATSHLETVLAHAGMRLRDVLRLTVYAVEVDAPLRAGAASAKGWPQPGRPRPRRSCHSPRRSRCGCRGRCDRRALTGSHPMIRGVTTARAEINAARRRGRRSRSPAVRARHHTSWRWPLRFPSLGEPSGLDDHRNRAATAVARPVIEAAHTTVSQPQPRSGPTGANIHNLTE
ncbi:hypothetical protein [Pseudonocardia sp. EC080610-09]|uniref:hypothetical protein n=1 Tax=unclassified Pseudonocardia TaxID=2619320 RepID=UPI003519B878